ncbi:hypothetical protein J3458_005094 [Metarhizium acridum]|uniref:uncharacterized protein n=1 Tax=Metarhizium acridum TaxID=92637 RepID=UPI001C6D1106|nr:hypothetical protein J3458_005094 [Metarhizium acridum]
MTPHGKYQELFAKTQFNNHEDDKHSGLIWDPFIVHKCLGRFVPIRLLGATAELVTLSTWVILLLVDILTDMAYSPHEYSSGQHVIVALWKRDKKRTGMKPGTLPSA